MKKANGLKNIKLCLEIKNNWGYLSGDNSTFLSFNVHYVISAFFVEELVKFYNEWPIHIISVFVDLDLIDFGNFFNSTNQIINLNYQEASLNH